MVAPVFESVYKTEKFLSCFFSDLWTIFTDIVYVISHFLQIRLQAINTLAFIFDLLIFEGNHLENKKYRFFLRKCLSTSLKMKPFSKLTSHRLCQQPKCPQTSAGLAQSVDRLHLWEIVGLSTGGPFLESPGNFTGPKSKIQIEI